MSKLASLTSFLRRVLQRWISLVALSCLAFVFYLCMIGIDRPMLFILSICIWWAAFFVFCLISALLERQPNAKRFQLNKADRTTLLLSFAFCVSIVLTQWPLRAAFALSRPTLERNAQLMKNGTTLNTPRFVGLLWVKHAEISPLSKTPCFWLDNSSSGRRGLVQGTPATAHHFNLWSTQEMSSGWQLVSED
jgi:hypothetical protein